MRHVSHHLFTFLNMLNHQPELKKNPDNLNFTFTHSQLQQSMFDLFIQHNYTSSLSNASLCALSLADKLMQIG